MGLQSHSPAATSERINKAGWCEVTWNTYGRSSCCGSVVKPTDSGADMLLLDKETLNYAALVRMRPRSIGGAGSA
eukprot:m.1481242 g.1481242  ORF g.1481242 m.1481242 type:complete len:75 (-) comp25174_c0_seq6:4056-4280(-)